MTYPSIIIAYTMIDSNPYNQEIMTSVRLLSIFSVRLLHPNEGNSVSNCAKFGKHMCDKLIMRL